MTPTPEPTELDCSAGAKMLIERMQTNPEDFEIGGKLHRVVYENHRMSVRDKKAVGDAYGEYIVEPQLMVEVLTALTAQPEQEPEGTVKFKSQGRYALGSGPNDPKMLYGVPIKGEGQSIYDPNTQTYNTATQQIISHEMIEQHRRHLAAHKENMRYLKEKAAAEEKLSWPEKFRSML